MATVTPTTLLTAEEYGELPDLGRPTELVRGRIVDMNVPYPRHGQVCVQIAYLLRRYLEDYDIGHVVSNDAGVVVERGPDTVRGSDVAFISYQKIPKGPLPRRYFEAAPELVFEVLSPSDPWSKVLQKVAEYLNAGTEVVRVVDPDSETVQSHFPDRPPVTLAGDDVLSFPTILPGFRVLCGECLNDTTRCASRLITRR
jgi:Uma2 family endonuclease